MMMTISAFDPADIRSFVVAVAGPMALLIARLHKVAERVAERDQRRLDDKDALDILRLLQSTDTSRLAATLCSRIISRMPAPPGRKWLVARRVS